MIGDQGAHYCAEALKFNNVNFYIKCRILIKNNYFFL